MKRELERLNNKIIGMHSGISGYVSGIYGYVTRISGNVTGISGNVSGISGNLDLCEITDAERKVGIDINDLIKKEEAE